MLGMRFLPKRRRFDGGVANSGKPAVDEMKGADVTSDAGLGSEEESKVLKTVGWISAALGAVALGLLVGRELRIRYKFNRRTPYDLYSHSGDELMDVDCGVGI